MRLTILLTPDFNIATTMAFVDPFRAANYLDGTQHFHWTFASLNGGACKASNGIVVTTISLKDTETRSVDLAVISSSWAPEVHATRELRAQLHLWARHGVPLGGLDTGAFLLAAAGLLDGHRATVHYEHSDAFGELFPQVEVSENLMEISRNRFTCCGGTASVDMALHIIRDSKGAALANAAARYVFHQNLRPANTPQNPPRVEPLGNTVPAKVRQAIRVMEENLEETVSIPRICEKARLSQRQMDRLFTRFIGKSPAAYYRDIRLDRARSLVTQTDMSISEVCVASGFSSQVHFSRAYRNRFGLPPSLDRIEGRVPFEYRAWPLHRRKR